MPKSTPLHTGVIFIVLYPLLEKYFDVCLQIIVLLPIMWRAFKSTLGQQ